MAMASMSLGLWAAWTVSCTATAVSALINHIYSMNNDVETLDQRDHMIGYASAYNVTNRAPLRRQELLFTYCLTYSMTYSRTYSKK